MMHEALKKEFMRLYGELITTDPSTPGYQMILRNFENLDSIGPTINDFLCMVDSTPNGDCNEDCVDCPNCESGEHTEDADVVEFPTPAPEPHDPVPEEPAPSPSEVRAKLAEARRMGVNVAAIVREFGVDNFTAIPATKYADLLKRVADEATLI